MSNNNTSIKNTRLSVAVGAALGILAATPPVMAQGPMLEEIVVTSRKVTENLQDVPISITAFSASQIEDAGIDEVQDFIDLTPNIILRETFRAGVTFVTIRGVTTGQQGWPPITYVVDGVQSASIDAINQGALFDIERIEVLKGPQGALYGAGAIAGAINVVTKAPTNEPEYGVKVSYGKGNNAKLSAMASGPIVEDKVLYRINAYYNDSDGLIDSIDGEDLDFEEQTSVRGSLLINASENVQIDLRAEYTDVEAGAAAQEIVPSADLIDTFNSTWGDPDRGLIGVEEREITNLSAKLTWETEPGTLTAVVGYSDIEQELWGSASWDKPPTNSIFGPVGTPGNPFADAYQSLRDDFETKTVDVRFNSASENALRWMVGASYLEREILNYLDVGFLISGTTPNNFQGLALVARPDIRTGEMWSVYGQLRYDISERMELSLSARYDEIDFDSTTYTDLSLSTPVPQPDPSGTPVNTLTASNDEFQPKVELSYNWTDDVMTYLTYGRGFRPGFFATGNLTLPETTDNFEIGFKSTLMEGRLRLNGALFRIDYSDQQFTFILPEPPFRGTTNIPETDIDGVELEFVAALSENLELSGGLGITNADVADGTTAPATPEHTGNLALAYTQPLSDALELYARIDYRRQGSFFMDAANLFEVEEKDFVNARLALQSDSWTVALFGNNLTDERQANSFTDFGVGFVRALNKPRSYGIEASYRF